MRAEVAISVFGGLSFLATALPTSDVPSSDLTRRQNIDFDLVNNTPDPVVAADNTTNYNQVAAIAAVKDEILKDPVPEDAGTITRRDIVVSNSVGYSSNLQLTGAAINAPLNCNGASAYNIAHPPAKGSAKTCQFYSTYALYKNDVYQGQYCSMYTQAWSTSYATNKGQWRGKDHYTIDQSFIATNTTNSGDVSCPSDIAYLSANGADFCTAYINYKPSTSVVTSVTTPLTSTLPSTVTEHITVAAYTTDIQTDLQTVTVTANQKRGVPTPASISSWSPSRISVACSAIATGVVTSTTVLTASTPYSTTITTQTQTETLTISVVSVTSMTSTATASPTAKTNLIRDPGFELSEDTSPWLSLNPNVHTDRISSSVDAHSGNSYVTLVSKDRNVGVYGQIISGLFSDKSYTMKFAHRQEYGSACFVQVYLDSVDQYYGAASYAPNYVYYAGLSDEEAYVTTSFLLTPPARASDLLMFFEYFCMASGTVRIDDVSLTLN
ncbi:hypothetical protein E4T43_03750 [Aureobasidium subglaciale]|nr:hypothetical protein E4T43_03750 [Aureobasidium subglaciale]